MNPGLHGQGVRGLGCLPGTGSRPEDPLGRQVTRHTLHTELSSGYSGSAGLGPCPTEGQGQHAPILTSPVCSHPVPTKPQRERGRRNQLHRAQYFPDTSAEPLFLPGWSSSFTTPLGCQGDSQVTTPDTGRMINRNEHEPRKHLGPSSAEGKVEMQEHSGLRKR